MISPELLRRYPFFAGLHHAEIETLAKVGSDVAFEPEDRFFDEGDELHDFWLVTEGDVAIVMKVPDREHAQGIAGQLTGDLITKDVTVTTVGPGEVFGWSALVPPSDASAGAKAVTPGRALIFDCRSLGAAFEGDWRFGFLMSQKAAQVMRERLRDMRIESLTLQG